MSITPDELGAFLAVMRLHGASSIKTPDGLEVVLGPAPGVPETKEAAPAVVDPLMAQVLADPVISAFMNAENV